MKFAFILLFSTLTLSVSAQKKDTSKPKEDSVWLVQLLMDTASSKLAMKLLYENIPEATETQKMVKSTIFDLFYKNARGIWYKIPAAPPAKTGKP